MRNVEPIIPGDESSLSDRRIDYAASPSNSRNDESARCGRPGPGSASATKSKNSSFLASMIHVDGFQSANFRGSGACHLLVLRACARRTKQPKPVKVSFLIDQVYGRFWPGCCRWWRNYRYRPCMLPDASGSFEETEHRDFTATWAKAAAAMTSQSRRQQSLSDRSSNSASPKSSAPRRKDATKSSYDF